jgi:alpha-mannosidase
MQQHPQYTRLRIAQLVERVRRRIYADTVPVEDLVASQAVDRISFEEAQRLAYAPARPGLQLGPAWATFWFKGRAPVPSAWAGSRVDLIWQSGSEATLWLDGRSVGGINPGRDEVPLVARSAGGETVEFQVEAACNGLFGQQGRPYRSVEPYLLDRCDLGRFDPEAWELYYDLAVLSELEREEDLDRDWRGRLLSELNRVANLYREEDRATWAEARRIAAGLYGQRNASYRHQVNAVGHAHIDTAWLWPIAETWRKCVRTFSTAVLYMDEYPEYRFACSQAVQYAEMKARFPDLYRRMQEKHRTGQWVPVGGTWVEPDCNIPSGEALCRQFLFGQRLFESEFGQRCREFWNPDVFGYNGQLPQIMRQAGIRYFLTQKLSWNHFNKPQHQTFLWQGLDGSEVLTHFPPANTYNAVATVEELRRSVREYRDHDRSGHSLLLFGIGDGGGGPTRDMLERLRRAQDLQGLPRTAIRAPADFFAQLEENCRDLPVRVGELYFELHRGTYTTQAAAKRGNRKAELLLHDVEFVAALGSRLGQAPYPKEALDQLWRLLLVNQFHDILPGSCAPHAALQCKAEMGSVDHAWRDAAYSALKSVSRKTPVATPEGEFRVFNTLPYPITVPLRIESFMYFREGAAFRDETGRELTLQEVVPSVRCANRRWEFVDTLPADGFVRYAFDTARTVERPKWEAAHFQPGHEIATPEARLAEGGVFSVGDTPDRHRPLFAAPPRFLVLRDSSDTWGHGVRAYDDVEGVFELASAAVLTGAVTSKLYQRWIYGHSELEIVWSLYPGLPRLDADITVQWRENRKLLKWELAPWGNRAPQFLMQGPGGACTRRTDGAELPLHHWVSIPGGWTPFALLQDGAFGCDCETGRLRVTLVRSSYFGYDENQRLFPADPQERTDQGEHRFRASLRWSGDLNPAALDQAAATFLEPCWVIRESGKRI